MIPLCYIEGIPSEMSDLQTARGWLREAHSVAVLTGAGISAESGIPVFRGPKGLWRKRRPETLATPQAFSRDPKLVWEWYDWRRAHVAEAEPNPGHQALAAFADGPGDLTLVTQNVDGLHDRAGSKNILKLHGDIWNVRCLDCGREEENHSVPLDPLPPKCDCGGMLRPGVVWFGEPLPVEILDAATRASAQAEVFVVAGTSAVVQPAASLPLVCRQRGGKIIEVNVDETPLSPYADAALRGPCGEVLPELFEPVRVQ